MKQDESMLITVIRNGENLRIAYHDWQAGDRIISAHESRVMVANSEFTFACTCQDGRHNVKWRIRLAQVIALTEMEIAELVTMGLINLGTGV